MPALPSDPAYGRWLIVCSLNNACPAARNDCIEAMGPMQWFFNVLEELGIECQVGDAAKNVGAGSNFSDNVAST